MAMNRQNASWVLSMLAVLLYVASFTLPDHFIHWTGPEGAPTHPGVVEKYYFLPEMARTFTPQSYAALDWAGWLGHLALFTGFVLLWFGQSRLAVGASVLALAFGSARYATPWTDGFLGGYYIWVASMVVLGLAGGLVWQKRSMERRSPQRDPPYL